jgi:hypothetical protein
MASVLILSFSRIESDPRVSRQVQALAGAHEVTTCGYGPAMPETVQHLEISPPRPPFLSRAASLLPLQIGLYERYYWSQLPVHHAEGQLRSKSFDITIANDLPALPLALRVAAGRPVIFDAHEYAPREFEDRALWRLLLQRYCVYLCRTYLPRVSAMMTVCQGIADEYARSFGVEPVVLSNATRYHELAPQRVEEGAIRMIHHGIAMRSRKLENMVDLMAHLDGRFFLDLMLMPTNPAYLARLQARAARNSRIRFLPTVPMQELVRLTSAYDVGLYFLEPTSFNNLHALPNKFFEFIQARLALAIGPSPEMARIVAEFDCGVVAEDFSLSSLARKLNALTPSDLDRMKRGADAAARALHAERNAGLLRELVGTTLARGRR